MRVFETFHGILPDDLDAIGVLHNTRYLLIFERALGAFWRHLGFAGSRDFYANPDMLQIVRENQVEYIRPVAKNDEVRVHTSVKKLGRTSLIIGFVMLPVQSDAIFAVGKRVMVKLDVESHRPMPFSDGFRTLMADWLHSDAESCSIIVERPGAYTGCPTIR